jgi:hypothetical protein
MTQTLNFVIFLNITFISFDKYYYYSQYHLLEIRILYNKLVIVLTVNTLSKGTRKELRDLKKPFLNILDLLTTV